MQHLTIILGATTVSFQICIEKFNLIFEMSFPIISDVNKWSFEMPSCAGGRQSPVNINPESAVVDSKMPALTFSNYDVIFPQTITNNGRTGLHHIKFIINITVP